jgi:phosphatidylinositol dimannoside acyltransferase
MVPVVASAAGTVAWLVTPKRRAMVARHLRRVRGDDLQPALLRRDVRAAFETYARYWLDTFRLPVVDPVELDRRAQVDGLELIDEALTGGRGAVIALPHLGSWDQAGAWLAYRGYPVTVVMERLQPPELLEWFIETRRRAGMHVVVRGKQVWQDLERALRQNRLVALVSDRDLSGRGVPVRFFGEETTLPPGPARLARQIGSPLLPVGVYIGPDRRWSAVARPPVQFMRTADERADIALVTQQLALELETLIRREPTQWHLMQPNWPSDRQAAARGWLQRLRDTRVPGS